MATEDLYREEQIVYDNAIEYETQLKRGAVCEPEKFSELVKEYGRLLRQIRRVTKLHDETTSSLRTKKEDLQNKVNFDTLTGVYSRLFFEDNLKMLKKSLAISCGELSILMVDIDFFKRFNDTYGHVAGDECLKIVASTLKESLSRQGDFVARYGGEEFVIVLPNTNEDGGRKIAEIILDNVQAKNIPHEHNDAADCVTISVGVTTVIPDYGHNEKFYIKCADDALYKSKQNGRNQYTYVNFSEE